MSNVPSRLTIDTNIGNVGSRYPIDPRLESAHRSVPQIYCDMVYNKEHQPKHLHCSHVSKTTQFPIMLHPESYDVAIICCHVKADLQMSWEDLNYIMNLHLQQIKHNPEHWPFSKLTVGLIKDNLFVHHGSIWYKNKNTGKEQELLKYEDQFWVSAQRIQELGADAAESTEPILHPLAFAAAKAFVQDPRLSTGTSTATDLVLLMFDHITRAQEDATAARKETTDFAKQAHQEIVGITKTNQDITMNNQDIAKNVVDSLIGLVDKKNKDPAGVPPSPRTQLKKELKDALLNSAKWVSTVAELLDFTDDEAKTFTARRDTEPEKFEAIIKSLYEQVDYAKSDLADAMDTIEVIQQVLQAHGIPSVETQFLRNMAIADDN